MINNSSQRIGTHYGIFNILVINTWDHVSCTIFATGKMIRQTGTLVWVNLID